MHHILPSDLTTTLADLSIPRLASYRNFFNPVDDRELYGIYCWNDAISIRFMRLIGIIEIIMRNRFHQNLSKFAYNTKSFGNDTSNNWYKYIVKDDTKTASQLKKKCKSLSSSMPAHQVIAGMSFGFWHNLIRIEKTTGNTLIPWDTIIPNIFIDHPQKMSGHWKKLHHRDQLFARIAYVSEFRNRVAHFEPLWKFGDLKDEWVNRKDHPVTIVEPAPVDAINSLRRLKICYARCLQLLEWLSKNRASDYKLSENHFSLEWLFTQDGLSHYRKIGIVEHFRVGSMTKSWGAKLAFTNGRAVVITKKSQIVGMYIPKLG